MTSESLFAFFFTTNRNQSNCLFSELDFKLVSRRKVEHRGVSLAYQKVAIALDLGCVGKLTSTFANAG